VVIGFIAASALLIAQAAGVHWVALLITAATVGIALWGRIHPLWALLGAAGLGFAGLV
jgi:hypothetical protein